MGYTGGVLTGFGGDLIWDKSTPLYAVVVVSDGWQPPYVPSNKTSPGRIITIATTYIGRLIVPNSAIKPRTCRRSKESQR